VGLRSEPHFKTVKGSITHKALELLGRRKLAEQEGAATFAEPELGVELRPQDVTPELAVDLAYPHYTQKDLESHAWGPEDKESCLEWTHKALLWNNGNYDPHKRVVIAVEKFFDIPLDEPWARYDYQLPDGRRFQGQLAVKGTMDAVFKTRRGLEIVDWKTGSLRDWGRKRQKKPGELWKDDQFTLYAFAASRLFPDVSLTLTPVYINECGPVPICYGPADFERGKELVRSTFLSLKDDDKPAWIRGDQNCRFCSFAKNREPESGKDLCQHFRDEIVELGLDRVTAQKLDSSRMNRYEGGGRSDG
jgi:hypothetical protein